jgi:hypothetical protein
MLNWLKSKWILLLAGFAISVALYALIGFKLVPSIIRSQAIGYAKNEWSKPLTLGEIKFNPFTLELDIRDINLQDQGKPLLSLQHLFVNFQASSLFKRAYVFNTILLEKPFARAVVKQDGSLNLADLLPKEKDDSPMPNIWINDLSVKQGQVNFADQSRELKPDKILTPISFILKDFKTRNDDGGFTFAAESDDNERFEWKGTLRLQPVQSKGQFKVSAFKATSAYEFISEELPFQLSKGSFDIDGNYEFSIQPKQGMQLLANIPKITATDLAFRPKKTEIDWLAIPSMVIANTKMDYQKESINVQSIALDGVQAKVWLEPDGSINLLKLTEQGANVKEASASAWQASIDKFSISKASIDLEDRTVKPSGKFQLSDTEFSTSGISLNLDKPLQIQMSSLINDVAPLQLSGSVLPSNFTAELAVDVSKMPVKQLLMYLPDYPGTEFKSGEAAAKGQITLDENANMAYVGDAVLDNVVLLDIKNKTEFLSLKKTTVQGINYKQAPESVVIDTITMDRPLMEVVITPQQTINILDLLATETTATSQSGAKEAVAELPIVINKMLFRSGVMAFADFSIQPNFKAKIENLNGHILSISTRPDAVAEIDLTGFVVNKFSPVVIKGKTSIFDFEQETDIKMAFRNIELPVFNPYSGRFAGYAIAKGKLTTELHYRINDKKLVADHHVVLDQLTWGQATDSKDKVSLPIRLATSLLKDKDGVIDLNVPVTGTIDDPSFRIGPIVWQIIKNILVKVVTAPFSFIGSLFAGAEQAQYVDFMPGSAVLSENAQKSLPILAKALSERSGVSLDIPAGTIADLDKAAISNQHFLAAVKQVLTKDGKDAPVFDSLETKKQIAVLEDLYKLQFGQKPDIPKPELTVEQEDSSRKEKKAAKKSIEVEWLEAQLRPKFQATDAELIELGVARGNAVQESLLSNGELDPARVFIANNIELKEQDGKVRMELQMK